MDPKTVLIDVDAIVADLATPWYRRYNEMYPDVPFTLTVDMVDKWDVGKAIGDRRIYGVLKTPGLYRELKPFQAAIDHLKFLVKMKREDGTPVFDVNFLTASITAPHILADKSHWLQEHFPFIGPKNHIYAYKKERVLGDFFIDDSPKNLAKWKAAQPSGKALTIDYPYNRDAVVDFRAYSYKDMDYAWESLHQYLVENAD